MQHSISCILATGSVLLFLLDGTALSQPSAAGPSTAEQSAVMHWQMGSRLFGEGRYGQAMTEFAQGYALSHKPGFLFNMAECQRLLGDRRQAHQLYVRYLVEHPRGKQREAALARCAELAVGPCGPEPSSASRPRPVVPHSAAAGTLRPAPPLPSAAHEGFLHSADVEHRPGPSHRSFFRRWPFWVGLGAAVVAGAITAGVVATRSGQRPLPAGDRVVDFTN